MLLAAAVAFSLYTQVSRVAFEGMREREQLLVDRGNQYKRAIQVYYAVNKRFPAKIEDLESTNNQRFLRRRYKDPMTGKDEWRLIHTNGVFLTDSLVQKPPAQNAANGAPGAGAVPGGGPLGANNLNTLPGPANGPGGADNGAAQPVAVNPAVLRRPSDRVPPGNAPPQGDNGAPGFFAPNYNPNDPSTWPPITLAPVNPQTGQPGAPGQPGQPGQPATIPGFGGQNVPGQQGNTQFNPFGGQPPQPGQPVIPGFGGQNVPGQPPTAQFNPPSFGGQPAQPGQPGFSGQPGFPTQPGTIPGFGGQNTPGQLLNTPPFGPPQNQGGDPPASFPPFQGQPNGVPPPTPSGIPGQAPGAGGFNPQSTNVFNPGLGFGGNPSAPDPSQQPPNLAPQNSNGAGNQPARLNQQLNPILGAINNQLTRPAGPAGAGANPQAGAGIAGVASTFEGTGIKIFHEHTKYKEWEFVFDPATAGGLAGQPVPGANGQNPPGQPSGQIPGAGQQPPGGNSTNPFGPMPNLFGPTPNPQGQAPNPAAPANPFAPAQSPFGQAPANPLAPPSP